MGKRCCHADGVITKQCCQNFKKNKNAFRVANDFILQKLLKT